MSGITVAYGAGVVDSDGCIRVKRSTYEMRLRGGCKSVIYQAVVQVKQVTPQAVDLLHATFGGMRFTEKASSARARPLHVWLDHSAHAGHVLEELLPYLHIKREQALNAIEVCRLVKTPRRFSVPEVKPDEPLVSLTEAAKYLGASYATVLQAVRAGSVPVLRMKRNGRKPSVFIPESFMETWATRGHTPCRSDAVSAALEECYRRSRKLNRVGPR